MGRYLFESNASSSSPAASGGGGPTIYWVQDGSSPSQVLSNNVLLYEFDYTLNQSLYTMIKVPNSYTTGSQLNLRFVLYNVAASGTILMQTVSTLIRTGTDLITSTTNQYTSTNSTFNGLIGDATPFAITCDLTDSNGKINSVSVSAGDLIKITFSRASGTATQNTFVPVYSAEVT